MKAKNLQKINLSFYGCDDLSDIGIKLIEEGIQQQKHLKVLQFNIFNTDQNLNNRDTYKCLERLLTMESLEQVVYMTNTDKDIKLIPKYYQKERRYEILKLKIKNFSDFLQ